MTTPLTGGQIAVLTPAALLMATVGIAGGIGTYANVNSVLHRSETALGIVAAGEGATLVAALVMLGVTMLGQPAPLAIRAALWLLPAAASTLGIVIAPTATESVVFAFVPLAMTVSAEGLGLLARRIVVHRTGIDIEAQRRNASIMRRIAYHQARAARHPVERVRARSGLAAWRLMSRVGDGDTQLGSGLIDVQRTRLTGGADAALAAMLGPASAVPELPVSPAPAHPEPDVSPDEPDPDFEHAIGSAIALTTPTTMSPATRLPATAATLPAPHQDFHPEPVLSPTDPTPVPVAEPGPGSPAHPELGPELRETQIAELAARLRQGERLTKASAAQLLGVSPATAGRRLKDARDRIGDGTGHYL
ncbi:hypothetical protein ACIQXD_05035 [Streptomyces uncialis]|uniref:hypothetical protein n=1 Tax=Streptomyces uncialis TaxID=1048205 RepID=UPI0037F8DF82